MDFSSKSSFTIFLVFGIVDILQVRILKIDFTIISYNRFRDRLLKDYSKDATSGSINRLPIESVEHIEFLTETAIKLISSTIFDIIVLSYIYWF